MIELRGVTWDHPRGYAGLRATALAWDREGFRVSWTVRSLQAFADRPVEELAADFDLLVIDHPSVGQAVAHRALVPFERHLGAARIREVVAASVGRSAESYVWGGSTWALPIDAAAQVAAVRPDLLERAGGEIPRTWPEVVRLAERLRAHGLWIAMPAIPVDAICSFLAMCVAAGDEPLRSPAAVADRAAARTALETLAVVIDLGHPESTSWNPPEVLDRMVAADDIAYCPLAFPYTDHARSTAPGHPLRYAGGPAGNDGRPCGTLGGAGLAVSSASAHLEEACDYAAFSMRGDIQRTLYLSAGGQPGHRSAWTDAEADAMVGGFFSGTLEAHDAAYLRPRAPGFLGFQAQAGELVHAWLQRRGDVDAVLDEIDDAWAGAHAGAGTGGGAR